MEMDLALKIVSLIALITFIILAVFSMMSISNAVKTIKEISITTDKLSKDLILAIKDLGRDLDEVKNNLLVSLNNFDKASNQVTNTARSIEVSTEGLRKTIFNYTSLFDMVLHRISRPVGDVAMYISAFTKALTTFGSFFNKGK